MKIKKKSLLENFLFFLLVLLSFTFCILININGGADRPLIMSGYFVLYSYSVNGIIQAALTFSCVLMVCVYRRLGLICSLAIEGVLLILNIRAIFFSMSLTPLPGFINAIITVCTILILSNQLKFIEKSAETDMATGFINRRGFTNFVDNHSTKHGGIAIVMIRLRNMESFLENLGLENSDILVKKVGESIAETVGKRGLVAKFDGMIFAVAVYGAKNAEEVAVNVTDAIGKKFVLTRNDVDTAYYFTADVGVAKFPKDGDTCDELIRCAGIAMNYAHDDLKLKYRAYDKSMEDREFRDIEIEMIIRDAINNEKFYLEYQPQYCTSNKKLRGFEALIRLDFEDDTKISPTELISVAEKSELIYDIDNYVLNLALDNFSTVIKTTKSDIVLSVNVSAKEMMDKEFPNRISTLLHKHKFPAQSLEIEITEYSFAKSTEQTVSNIIALKDLGVMIALDDFGTGYTSLSQLLHLPINMLKIDKSLIDQIQYNSMNRDFVDSVIYMGHLMKCKVIAEGVESEVQLDILNEHGCDYIQGFIWSKPIPFVDTLIMCSENV